MGFPEGSVDKESACNAGDTGDAGSIPGSGRSPGGGHGNPFQYSCLKNPMNMSGWVKVAQSCLTLCNPWTIQSMEFSRPEYQSGKPFPSPGNLPNPGIKPRSPALQADFLPAEPQEKPKNTGVVSLSLPQGIFLTWKSNWGLLHCRQILYQLNYQGSL